VEDNFFKIHNGSFFIGTFLLVARGVAKGVARYLLNYRYSYIRYYGKAVKYLIKDYHIKNYDTKINTKSFQCHHYFLLLLQILDEGINYDYYHRNTIFSESLLSDTQLHLHSNACKNFYS